MADSPITTLQLDARALRVLAHPLRSRILTALRRDGAATATSLAESLSTNTGATSYHLRKLADVDLVRETDGGRGRERRWAAATDAHGWRERDVADDPDGEAASLWLRRHYLQQFADEVGRWLDSSDAFPLAWRDAAGSTDRTLALSPAQVVALEADLIAVIDRYAEPDPDPEADVRRVRLQVHAFPVVPE